MLMDKVYNQTKVEQKWYKFWEKAGYFKPEINPDGKPFTIILPPPNANAPLHFGHAMYTIEDILIRYHRMKGEATLWLPGADHAGFETQFVFEKHLENQGKSRFDYDRTTLYQMIWDFVAENRGNMEQQLKRLGFSLDWSRQKFTLDPDIVKVVYKTFKKLFDDGLVYRTQRLVNYCTTNGTSFSDLEVVYEERKDPLYYVRYPLINSKAGEPEYLVIATTRPEPIMIDDYLAINPKDKKNSRYTGRKVKNPLTDKEMKIIADDTVDPTFGTGIIKLTPAHDMDDFARAQIHNLPIVQVIGFDGRLNASAGKFSGMSVKAAKQAVVEELEQKELLEKVDYEYKHRIGLCYKCKNVIEPLPLEQWFIKVEPLAKKAIEAVKSGKIKIYPKNFAKIYFNWLKNIRDWNISRQIIWGIQIPAWYCDSCKKWTVTEGEKPDTCSSCNDSTLEQDQDTFDTWFSSGQWTFATLQTTNPPAGGDFEKFYPTQIIETGREILFFWVARMIMLGLYATNKIPFQDIVLHGMVLDPLGKKMSKSKNNVVNPLEVTDQYGADAARMALIYGTALGHDQSLSHPKLQAMRNFTNKLWNIGRFIIEFNPNKDVIARSPGRPWQSPIQIASSQTPRNDNADDKEIIKKLAETTEKVTKALEAFRFHDAANILYDFIWHEFADKYIESTKERRAEAQPVLEYVFKTSLELLHPFMPFITEELWQKLPHKGESIMISDWPRA